MRGMPILILIVLGWVMLASAQNSPTGPAAEPVPASQAPACQARSGQFIGQRIARAGYRDIRMVPHAFVVRAHAFVIRAKDPSGVPNSMTAVTQAAPAETSDLPTAADTLAPARCVLPNAEEGIVGVISSSGRAFDVAAMDATLGWAVLALRGAGRPASRAIPQASI